MDENIEYQHVAGEANEGVEKQGGSNRMTSLEYLKHLLVPIILLIKMVKRNTALKGHPNPIATADGGNQRKYGHIHHAFSITILIPGLFVRIHWASTGPLDRAVRMTLGGSNQVVLAVANDVWDDFASRVR